MDESLVLRIRAETLRTNLKQTRSHLKRLPALRSHLAALGQQLHAIRKLSLELKREELNWEIDFMGQANPTCFELAKNMIANLVAQVSAAHANVAELEQLSFYIPDDPIVSEVSERLISRTTPADAELVRIEHAIHSKHPIDRVTWESFRQKAVEPSQAIFAEYVDLLGGIAIRDSRFEAGICKIADELIQSYQPSPSAKFPIRTIPTRFHTMFTTLARIIRLSFPEWTVWALPLTAYEFWFIDTAPSFDHELQHCIGATTGQGSMAPVDLWSQRCLADAFATYTMGPAYGYATITLLLDPKMLSCLDPDEVCHEIRAYTIMETLRLMNRQFATIDMPYTRIIDDLAATWQAAVRQTGAARSEAEEVELARQKDRASMLLQALSKILEAHGCATLTIEAWNQVVDWKGHLLKGAADLAELPIGVELRQMLNAAWLARVEPARGPDVDLTEAVLNLLSRVGRPKPGLAGIPRGVGRRI